MNNRSTPSTHAERKITVCSQKHSFTPYPSLSPYSQMDRMTDRGMNTLAAHGLEELFFQLCHCVSFFLLWRDIVLGVTYLPYQLCCCVWLHRSVFWLWREKVLCYLLTNHTSCAVVSVFCFWQEIVFGCTVSKKDSYLVSLRERGSVYQSFYHLTVTIASQKYRELSLQVEIWD